MSSRAEHLLPFARVSEDNLVDVGDKPRQADTTLIPKGMNE